MPQPKQPPKIRLRKQIYKITDSGWILHSERDYFVGSQVLEFAHAWPVQVQKREVSSIPHP